MSVLEKEFVVTMPDGSRWAVPVAVIALDRAKYYADIDFNGDQVKSIQEDTGPLFEGDHEEISEWASNNMNWDDVLQYAVRLASPPPPCDFQEGWVTGEWKIEERVD